MEDEQLKGLPSMSLIEQERSRLNYRHRYYRAIRSTIYVLVVVAAIAVLIATLFLPVFQITGTSMEPNMNDGDIVVAVKTTSFEQGQVVGFYFNNKLVERKKVTKRIDTLTHLSLCFRYDSGVRSTMLIDNLFFSAVDYLHHRNCPFLL